MKKIIGYLFRIIVVVVLIIITILLGVKVCKDTKKIKMYEEESLNIEAESKYFIDTINSNLTKIEKQIEKETGKKIELANSGTICKIELAFVVEDNGAYKYIICKNDNGTQKFEVAQENNSEEDKYVISYKDLGLDDCVFTNIENYVIDRDRNVEYIK